MATDYNTISYTGDTEPIPDNFPNERAFAQAFQEWGNRRNLQLLINQSKSLGVYNDDNTNSGTVNTSAQTPDKVTVSTPINTGQKTGKNLIDQNFPGKRKDNPLSSYSSYTYSLTLYMVTPEFMNEFTGGPAAGTIPANRLASNQIFVVAQSAGVNNNVDSRAITFSKKLGPKEQGLDYFIDDLTYTTTLPGANGSSTNTLTSFKIIEPNGFSFLDNLATAAANLNNISSLVQSSVAKPNAAGWPYIISIRYYGYDATGNLVKPKDGGVNFSDSSAISERHLPITIRDIKFKLDEKATIYTIDTVNLSEQGTFQKSNGIVEQQVSVSGSTVSDVLLGGTGSKGLLQVINSINQEKKDKNKTVTIANEYTIEFIGKDNPIAKSKLIDDKDFESRISKMSSVSSTSESNIKASYKAVTVNTTARSLSIAAGTPILQAIDNIIVKSDFVTSSLNKINTGSPEAKTTNNAATKPLQWYSVNPVVTIKGMDPKTNTWAYKINYQISVYNVSYIRSPYVSSKIKYPGPYKYYGYYLTGENTEILEYEQTYNHLYQINIGRGTNSNEITPTNVSGTSGSRITSQPVNSSPVGGKLFKGSEINESVKASLNSPSDQNNAKIKILGDPDYIMSSVGVNQNVGKTASVAADKFYGPDNSINPFSGQVFIQIMFNATSDYQNNGVMDISDKIQFYDTKRGANEIEASGIKGLVYTVHFVESTFSKGMFTQVLNCVIVPEKQLLSSTDNKPVERVSTSNGSSTNPANSGRQSDVRQVTYSPGQSDSDLAEQQLIQRQTETLNQSTISQVQSYESALPGANDDQVTVANRQIQTGGIVQDTAREVFGNESVNAFGSTDGGAAFGFNRNAARNQRIQNQRL